MSEEENEQLQSNNTCWICEKPIDNDVEKVGNQCHITGKIRGVCSSLELYTKSSIN